MTQPLVSVVIPTFNRADCVGQAVSAALGQTHSRVEVLVVDDGSTDDTAKRVTALAADDPRIRYARQDNAGVSAARNHGFRLVRGEFVALLDSDDTWVPWKLEVQLACLRAFPEAGMVWTDIEAIDAEGRVLEPRYLRLMYSAYRWFPRPEDLFERSTGLATLLPPLLAEVADAQVWCGDIFSQMLMGNLVHTSTVLLRRERLDKVGGFDEGLRVSGEDYDFHLRTCREGAVAYADLPTVRYQRCRSDRLTRPEYSLHLARNFLRTLTRTLGQDRDRIRLPPRMIAESLLEGHTWLGEAALSAGQGAEARRHLLASLRLRPGQFRTMGLLGLAILPTRPRSLVRSQYARLKRAVRHLFMFGELC